MKRLSYFLTVLAAFVMVAATTASGQTQLKITKASTMSVSGTSTVHDWTCDVDGLQGTITLDTDLGEVSSAVVSVPSAAVDCDNGTMNKKAAQALETDDYPTIQYTLKNAGVQKEGERLSIEAVGMLDLAGTKKEVSSKIVGQPVGDGAYKFVGTLSIAMSDFGIDAPTAMFGAIRAGDDVTVRFELVGSPGQSGLSSAR